MRPFPPGRRRDVPPARALLARPLVAVLVPLLGLAYLQGEKTVTLLAPGGTHQLATHATTVGELLDRLAARSGGGVGVALPEQAAGAAPNRPLHDGDIVPVGTPAQRRAARTARAAGRIGLLDVVVVVDGRQVPVRTTAASVGAALHEAGIVLGPEDRVSPPPRSYLSDGLQVTVARVVTHEVVRTETVPHGTEERPSDDLPAGQRRVVREGRDGLRRVVEHVVVVDGVEESRITAASEVIRAPVSRVEQIGTRAPAAARARAEPQPEAAPAERPASSAGHEHAPSAPADAGASAQQGGAQEGQASWYDHPRGGMIAAHRTLPFGTVVTVTNLDTGATVQVTIQDRGPFIDGRVIDLNRQAFAAIADPAAGVCRVRITW